MILYQWKVWLNFQPLAFLLPVCFKNTLLIVLQTVNLHVLFANNQSGTYSCYVFCKFLIKWPQYDHSLKLNPYNIIKNYSYALTSVLNSIEYVWKLFILHP